MFFLLYWCGKLNWLCNYRVWNFRYGGPYVWYQKNKFRRLRKMSKDATKDFFFVGWIMWLFMILVNYVCWLLLIHWPCPNFSFYSVLELKDQWPGCSLSFPITSYYQKKTKLSQIQAIDRSPLLIIGFTLISVIIIITSAISAIIYLIIRKRKSAELVVD